MVAAVRFPQYSEKVGSLTSGSQFRPCHPPIPKLRVFMKSSLYLKGGGSAPIPKDWLPYRKMSDLGWEKKEVKVTHSVKIHILYAAKAKQSFQVLRWLSGVAVLHEDIVHHVNELLGQIHTLLRRIDPNGLVVLPVIVDSLSDAGRSDCA